eukprot:CAMPEP_0194324098 /NCGR_PEP_ID=MMETSP0171-20130528/26490_1 /TAXON_ID=218684 /ORGANISM="Corethron pennatum, Strain L29A3" /LENGTH=619 /DNA_ID=CAMNT_0039082909 /DNA_START=200 /DNA_END=2059 /DNA_ORIENTATION=-
MRATISSPRARRGKTRRFSPVVPFACFVLATGSDRASAFAPSAARPVSLRRPRVAPHPAPPAGRLPTASPRRRVCAALWGRAVDYEDDYYEALGVTRTASADDIRSAFRRMARTLHPDRFVEELKFDVATQTVSEIRAFLGEQNIGTAGVFERSDLNELATKANKSSGAIPAALQKRREEKTNRFARINLAYTTLYDPKSRKMYDLTGDWGTGRAKKTSPSNARASPSNTRGSTSARTRPATRAERRQREAAESANDEARRQRERTEAIQRNAARERKQKESAQSGARRTTETWQERVRADAKTQQDRTEAIRRNAKEQREQKARQERTDSMTRNEKLRREREQKARQERTDSMSRNEKLKREQQFNWRLRQEQAEALQRKEAIRKQEEARAQARAQQERAEAERRKVAAQKKQAEGVQRNSYSSGNGQQAAPTMTFQERVRAEGEKLAAEKQKEREAAFAAEKAEKAKRDAEWRKEWNRKEAAEAARRKEADEKERVRAEKARAEALQRVRAKGAQRSRQPLGPGTVQQFQQPDPVGTFDSMIAKKRQIQRREAAARNVDAQVAEGQQENAYDAEESNRLEVQKQKELLKAVQLNAYELDKLDEERDMNDDFLRSLMD